MPAESQVGVHGGSCGVISTRTPVQRGEGVGEKTQCVADLVWTIITLAWPNGRQRGIILRRERSRLNVGSVNHPRIDAKTYSRPAIRNDSQAKARGRSVRRMECFNVDSRRCLWVIRRRSVNPG